MPHMSSSRDGELYKLPSYYIFFSLKETKVFAANSAEEIGVDAHGLILSVWSANCNASLILVSFFSWFGWWSMCEALMTRTWGSCGGRQVQGMVMDTRLTLIPTASTGDYTCSTPTSRLFSRWLPRWRRKAVHDVHLLVFAWRRSLLLSSGAIMHNVGPYIWWLWVQIKLTQRPVELAIHLCRQCVAMYKS